MEPVTILRAGDKIQNTKIPSLMELAFHQVEVDTKKRIKTL